MSMGTYIKNVKRGAQAPELIRRCLNCGVDVGKQDSYLYRQSFCSAECKEKYIAHGGY